MPIEDYASTLQLDLYTPAVGTAQYIARFALTADAQ